MAAVRGVQKAMRKRCQTSYWFRPAHTAFVSLSAKWGLTGWQGPHGAEHENKVGDGGGAGGLRAPHDPSCPEPPKRTSSARVTWGEGSREDLDGLKARLTADPHRPELPRLTLCCALGPSALG